MTTVPRNRAGQRRAGWRRRIKRKPWLRHPLECPKCGNRDPEKMTLWVQTISWDRWYHQTRSWRQSSIPVTPERPSFEYGKGGDISDSTEPPEMWCDECGEEWVPEYWQFDLG